MVSNPARAEYERRCALYGAPPLKKPDREPPQDLAAVLDDARTWLRWYPQYDRDFATSERWTLVRYRRALMIKGRQIAQAEDLGIVDLTRRRGAGRTITAYSWRYGGLVQIPFSVVVIV
jgi:hypothetical protein